MIPYGHELYGCTESAAKAATGFERIALVCVLVLACLAAGAWIL